MIHPGRLELFRWLVLISMAALFGFIFGIVFRLGFISEAVIFPIVAICVAGACLIAARDVWTILTSRAEASAFLLVLLLSVSVSANPLTAFKLVLSLLIVMLLAVCLATQGIEWGLRVWHGFGLTASVCALLVAALPHREIFAERLDRVTSVWFNQLGYGSLAGVTASATVLSWLASIALLIEVSRIVKLTWGVTIRTVVLVIGLVLSGSAASMLGVILALFSYSLIVGISKVDGLTRRRLMSIAGLGLAFIITVAASWWTSVLSLLGRSPDLTGRIPLFEKIFQDLGEFRLIGFGPGTYWEHARDLGRLWADGVGWEAGSAHNAILELLLTIGPVGLVVGILLLISIIRGSLTLRDNQRALYLAFLVLILVESSVGSDLLLPSVGFLFSFWLYYSVRVSHSFAVASVSHSKG